VLYLIKIFFQKTQRWRTGCHFFPKFYVKAYELVWLYCVHVKHHQLLCLPLQINVGSYRETIS